MVYELNKYLRDDIGAVFKAYHDWNKKEEQIR